MNIIPFLDDSFFPVPKSLLFSPPPSPPFSFHPYAYPKGFYFYSPQSSSLMSQQKSDGLIVAIRIHLVRKYHQGIFEG